MQGEPSRTGKRISSRSIWILAGGLVAVAPLVMGLRHGFYEDDFWWLEKAFLAGKDPSLIITPWYTGLVRPLAQILLYGEFLLFGFNPLGYNVISLCLHLVATILVFHVAAHAGVSGPVRVIAALLFLGGLGHYGKAVAWWCSQPILFGTIFTLASVLVFLSHRRSEPDGSGRSQLLVPLLLLGCAVLSHEIFVLTPVALATLAMCLRHPRRLFLGVLAPILVAFYLFITFGFHLQHPAQGSGILHVLRNAAYFAVVLFAPLQRLDSAMEIGGRIGLPHPLVAAAPLFMLIAGALLWIGSLFVAVRSTASRRGILLFGMLLLLPVLPIPFPPEWTEVRYLYPIAAFLAPLIAACIYRLWQSIPRRFTPLLVVALAAWCLGIVAGTSIQQLRTIEHSRDAKAEKRWERLNAIREGRPAVE